MVQWVARPTCNLLGAQTPSKAAVVFLKKKRYPHCLVLFGSRTNVSVIYMYMKKKSCFSIKLN